MDHKGKAPNREVGADAKETGRETLYVHNTKANELEQAINLGLSQ